MVARTNTDKIPSIEQCYQIMSTSGMLPNIIKHSEQVMRVASIIFDNLKPGIHLNKRLTVAASLLHDIKKTESLTTREPHDIRGAEFIRGLGYIKLAEIVEEHVILKNFVPDSPLQEKELVFYADKRVMHDQIVSVGKRIEDLLVRYGNTKKRRTNIMGNKEIILRVEKKINSNLNDYIDNILNFDKALR